MAISLPMVPELDYQVVMDSLRGHAFPRKTLSDMTRRGALVRVKKGVYIQHGPGIAPYSREVLANMVYGPSHVSYDYALSMHGLIPERVEVVASATTGKTKLFDTPVGRFRYHHQSVSYYSIGYEQRTAEQGRGYLIARPEKALADKVLLTRGQFSQRSMREYLFDNLRIDEEHFRALDTRLLSLLAARSGRRSLQALSRVRERMT